MHLCTGSEIWNLIRNPADQRSDPCDLRDHRIPSREWCFTQLFINKPLAFGNDGQPWLTMVNPVILSYLYINHFFLMGMIYNWVYHVYPCPSFIFNMITHTQSHHAGCRRIGTSGWWLKPPMVNLRYIANKHGFSCLVNIPIYSYCYIYTYVCYYYHQYY